jgi:cell division protein FtsB
MNLQRRFKIDGNWNKIGRVAMSVGISLGLILFSAAVIFDTLGSFAEAHQKALIVKKEAEKVEELRLENLRKKQGLDYVISSNYVEKEARSKFNYMKNGEVVFVLPETADDQEINLEDLQSNTTTSSPLEEWLSLLLN